MASLQLWVAGEGTTTEILHQIASVAFNFQNLFIFFSVTHKPPLASEVNEKIKEKLPKEIYLLYENLLW